MPSGGARAGAGRPARSGAYQEITKPIRIPESLISDVKAYIQHKAYKLPLYGSRVSAGFPSPADDHLEDKLDLNTHLIQHPAATFFVRVRGNSMIDAGIHDNDLLIVDKSLEPVSGKIVIAVINGELTVKRYRMLKDGPYLMPENPHYKPIPLHDGLDVHIWGVVTNVIHHV
jgi:DNA polymerase V